MGPMMEVTDIMIVMNDRCDPGSPGSQEPRSSSPVPVDVFRYPRPDGCPAGGTNRRRSSRPLSLNEAVCLTSPNAGFYSSPVRKAMANKRSRSLDGERSAALPFGLRARAGKSYRLFGGWLAKPFHRIMALDGHIGFPGMRH